jgi:signal transduction histidine kinase
MRTEQLTELFRTVRDQGPSTVRSLVQAIDGPLNRMLGTSACALEVYRPGAIYLSGRISGIDDNGLAALFGIRPGKIKDWTVIDTDVERRVGPASSISVASLPFYYEGHEAGRLYILGGPGKQEHLDEASAALLSEAVSAMIHPCLDRRNTEGSSSEESLRTELLEASGDDGLMRGLLCGMMRRAGAEFCAYMTVGGGGTLHLMTGGREYSALFPEIREKLRTSLRMFTNGRSGQRIERERIYHAENSPGVSLPAPSAEIESYFLVPVTSGPGVEGVLFFGSVRRDAFVRETISRFRLLAQDTYHAGRNECGDNKGGGMLEQLLLSIPYGAAIIDGEGNVTRANEALHAILGGIPFERIDEIGERSVFDIRTAWDEFSRFGRNITDRQIDSSARDGRSISLSMIRMESIQGEARSVIVVRDTTEFTGMEHKREEAMAVVAHEIRTPMTALKNSLRILSDAGASGKEVAEDADSPGRRFFETALRTVDRLSSLVDGLLDASMVRHSGSELKIERVALRPFLEDSSLLFFSSMTKKEISFGIDIDEKAKDAFIDRGMMEQVIQNLLSNSLKHVPVGGEVRIRVRAMERAPEWISGVLPVAYTEKPGYMLITISDSGPGIPDEVARSINVPITAAPAAIKPARGIGLYIAARLVKLHGGRLIIEAGENGSTIDIYLPSDIETSEIMRGIIAIQSSIDSLVSIGASPILYVMTRDEGPCWLDVAGTMRERPVINPAPAETGRSGICFWPMGERLAFAMTAERKYRESPMSLFGNGSGSLRIIDGGPGENPDTGWAVCPDDGRDYASLLEAALERMNGGAGVPLRKGEKEWTATGSLS